MIEHLPAGRSLNKHLLCIPESLPNRLESLISVFAYDDFGPPFRQNEVDKFWDLTKLWLKFRQDAETCDQMISYFGRGWILS